MMIEEEETQFVQQQNFRHNNLKDDFLQFQHPTSQFLSQAFSTLSEFKALLEVEKMKIKENLWICRRVKNKYVYLTCKFCSCFINIKSGQSCQITNFKIYHYHRSKSYKKQQQQAVVQYIQTLTNIHNLKQLKLMTLNNFAISQRRFYYIVNKSSQVKSFPQILRSLQLKNYDFLTHFGSQKQFPEILLFNNQSMRKMFCKHGDIITFDITYNCIKKRSSTNKQWGTAIFSGFDTNLRLTIFAIALIANQTTSSFKTLFQGFFTLYGRQPKIFISDQQISIQSAFAQLKQQGRFHGFHLLDTFHILKNLRKKVQKDELVFYKNLIKARNTQKYQNLIQKTLLKDEINQNILQQFLKKSQKFCFSTCPVEFIGFSSSNSRNQKCNDILKGFIPHQVSFASFFQKAEKFVKHIQSNLLKAQYQTKKFQDLFHDNGLKVLRLSVEKKIFERFLQNYSRAIRLVLNQISNDHFVCISHSEKWNIYCIQNKLVCRCELLEKSGLPCEHILKVLWYLGNFNYLVYVNKRWIREAMDKQQTRGRPRKSRKNIIK